ncbi:unnamed protein product [Amoebophrya sp. A120]|nr:unnamed protein product [Amoebophrya sp. A120]|eukprot:GSA120T00009241001.1
MKITEAVGESRPAAFFHAAEDQSSLSPMEAFRRKIAAIASELEALQAEVAEVEVGSEHESFASLDENKAHPGDSKTAPSLYLATTSKKSSDAAERRRAAVRGDKNNRDAPRGRCTSARGRLAVLTTKPPDAWPEQEDQHDVDMEPPVAQDDFLELPSARGLALSLQEPTSCERTSTRDVDVVPELGATNSSTSSCTRVPLHDCPLQQESPAASWCSHLNEKTWFTASAIGFLSYNPAAESCEFFPGAKQQLNCFALRIQDQWKIHKEWKRKKRRLARSDGFAVVEKIFRHCFFTFSFRKKLWTDDFLKHKVFARYFILSRKLRRKSLDQLLRNCLQVWRHWKRVRRCIYLHRENSCSSCTTSEKNRNKKPYNSVFHLSRDFCWGLVKQEGKHSVANRGRLELLRQKTWLAWVEGVRLKDGCDLF